MTIIALMKEEAVKRFLRIYGKSIPLKKKFNFTGFCKDVKSLIDEDYDYLLMKKKDILSKNKKREFLRAKLALEVNDINFNEKSSFKTKKKKLLKKQKLMLSSYNNKMFLDLMLNNKKYIKYITEKNSDNCKTRNNRDNKNEKQEDSINNFIENNICSRINTLETMDEFSNKKSITLNNLKTMNKTHSKFAPINLKKLIKQNNTFFKTAIPKENQINSQNLRSSLFNMHQKKNVKKYIIKSKHPILNIDYNQNNFINLFKETENKKNDDSIKTCFNYNKSSRNKFIINEIQSRKDPVEKNNYFNENNNNSEVSKKKNKFISNSNYIKNVKSSILKVKFNPIKTIYKTQINI